VRRVAAIVGGFLGALASVAGAQAADPPRSRPYEEVVPASPFRELASGWYLRADVGYRWYNGGPSVSSSTGESYSDGFNGTVGFGFKYHWFRADLTYDRGTPTRISINTSAPVGQPQIGAKVRPETVLANAYLDLGSWWGFTPYVGAGAGVARLESKNYSDTAVLQPAGGWARGRSHNFAWAAMGGVAFQLSPRWMIDVGYRYLSLGDAASTDETVPTAGSPTPYFKGITAHETRIGVRFLLD
jgi:opacity protein-like surface antigen